VLEKKVHGLTFSGLEPTKFYHKQLAANRPRCSPERVDVHFEFHPPLLRSKSMKISCEIEEERSFDRKGQETSQKQQDDRLFQSGKDPLSVRRSHCTQMERDTTISHQACPCHKHV
jgi:hypothetical protein